jgi:hypothetical protein
MFTRHHDDSDRQDADAGAGDSDHLPRLVELGQALDDAVLAAAAEPLPKLAAKLMADLFGSEYHPGDYVDLNSAAGPLIPPNSGSKLGDPTPDGVRILDDIAVEAVQLLEHANLIAPAHWYSGDIWYFGYRSTRAGRTAVEQGTVEAIVTREISRATGA